MEADLAGILAEARAVDTELSADQVEDSVGHMCGKSAARIINLTLII